MNTTQQCEDLIYRILECKAPKDLDTIPEDWPKGLLGMFFVGSEYYFVADADLWQTVWEGIQPNDRYVSGGCLAASRKYRPVEIGSSSFLVIGGGRWTAIRISEEVEAIYQNRKSAAAALGSIGGKKTARKGPEYFSRISGMRKNKRGGKPKKDVDL